MDQAASGGESAQAPGTPMEVEALGLRKLFFGTVKWGYESVYRTCF